MSDNLEERLNVQVKIKRDYDDNSKPAFNKGWISLERNISPLNSGKGEFIITVEDYEDYGLMECYMGVRGLKQLRKHIDNLLGSEK